MALNTPKRIKTLATYANSPQGSDCSGISSWNWTGGGVSNVGDGGDCGDGSLSPASSCGSPEFIARPNQNILTSQEIRDRERDRENRRGRPRSESLTTLMIQGSTSPSAIKCRYCNRVFPRDKSLQAHLRTHTGERPYTCDYPGCTRAFTQSGQLKTHQRLHTGERPFMCSAQSCLMRFTHANRHCPDHPLDQLKRCDDFVIQPIPEQNTDVIKWWEKYRLEREDKTPTRKSPTRKTPKRLHQSKMDNNENISDEKDIENNLPITPNNTYKSRKGLMVELDMNAGMAASPVTSNKIKLHPKMIEWQEPLSQEEDEDEDEDDDDIEIPARSTFNPKKKWLRDAWQDDLAKPLEPITNNIMTMKNKIVPNPNQMRPTVLMVASKDKAIPLINNSLNIVSSQRHIPKHQSHNLSEPPGQQQQQNLYNYNQITNVPQGSSSSSSSSSLSSISSSLSLSPPINSLPPIPPKPKLDENRKWLGALALMQLATDDNINENIINNNETNQSNIDIINNELTISHSNNHNNNNENNIVYDNYHTSVIQSQRYTQL